MSKGPLELHLFAMRNSGMSKGAFEHCLRTAAGISNARLVLRIDDAMDGVAHADETASAGGPADAILTWREPPDLSPATLETIAAALDTERSTLFAGERHDIVPGVGTVLISFALNRLPTLNRAGFQLYWLHHHADHGRRTLISPNTYAQIHSVDAGGEACALAAALGVPVDEHDGIAECYFPTSDAFAEQMSRAAVAVDALEDEKRFIDHARSTFGLFAVQR